MKSGLVKSLFLACTMVLLFSLKAASHPWGGLVIDNQGNIYFTFICPMVDNDHYACVWKINSVEELSEVLQSNRSPSDIILSRSPDRIIYGAERTGQNPDHTNSLWLINETGSTSFIEPSRNQNNFHIQAYAVSGDKSVFFARGSQIYIRDKEKKITELKLDRQLERIQLLSFSPSGELYILSGDNLYKHVENSLTVIAEGLRQNDPENIPFRGANILFDMAIDEEANVYLAYYGNREVIKVLPNGEQHSILKASAPWSPHGIDVLNGEVYVLESTLGDGRWWEFWNRSDTEIIPRIRKIDRTGAISTVYEYAEN